ncbi:MFS transporter [Actinokineospora inagensis]|uniref:MFS transporter n=1 Tax=Actinokineospora inagensis TaxID=103730 RepID=UPI00068918E1|nr:MFS transporter [Actinokineospora inagensis]
MEPQRVATAPPPRETGPTVNRPGLLLVALLGGLFLGNIDIAVVNVAIPSIRERLGAGPSELELVVSGYTLAYALLLITGARLGEIVGRRRVYVLGLTAFTALSLACGLAPTGAVLVWSLACCRAWARR